MNQGLELFALKRGVSKFLDRVRPMVDTHYDVQMVRISNSTAFLIDNLEERVKRRSYPTLATEQLGIERWVTSAVINILRTNRIVKAKLAENHAVYRGEKTQPSEVDENRIERETVSELNNLWCEVMSEQAAF